jgi:hypothetical protein
VLGIDCPVVAYNLTYATPACNGHGSCNFTSGECLCNPGYGGVWCCPQSSTQDWACGVNGCCLSNGECACTSDLYVGPTCEGNSLDAQADQPTTPATYTAQEVVAVPTVAIVMVASTFIATGSTLYVAEALMLAFAL